MRSHCDDNVTIGRGWASSRKEVCGVVLIVLDDVVVIRELPQLFSPCPQLLTHFPFIWSITA